AAYPAVRETPLADSFQMRCKVRFQVAFDPLDANGSAGDGLAFGVKNPTVHRPLCHEPQRHFVFVYCSPVRAMLVRKGEHPCRVGLLRFCLLICPRHDKSESAVLAACTQEANRLISRAGTTKVEFRPSNRLAFGIQHAAAHDHLSCNPAGGRMLASGGRFFRRGDGPLGRILWECAILSCSFPAKGVRQKKRPCPDRERASYE